MGLRIKGELRLSARLARTAHDGRCRASLSRAEAEPMERLTTRSKARSTRPSRSREVACRNVGEERRNHHPPKGRRRTTTTNRARRTRAPLPQMPKLPAKARAWGSTPGTLPGRRTYFRKEFSTPCIRCARYARGVLLEEFSDRYQCHTQVNRSNFIYFHLHFSPVSVFKLKHICRYQKMKSR